MHLYWLTPSTQVPPFWQGLLAHSLISVGIEENDHSGQTVDGFKIFLVISIKFSLDLVRLLFFSLYQWKHKKV